MNFLVVIEQGENCFSAYVPDLPVCVSMGDTEQEVKILIREAINLYIEELQNSGAEIPKPLSKSEYVEVSGA